MSLFALFDAFRWVCAFFHLVTKLAQANKMNVCVFAPRWKGSKELWWKLELARRYTHSCEQRIQYNIHARHSTSTHTNLFIASVEPSPYQCTMASHLSLKSIYIKIWFDCLFSRIIWNFTKKYLLNLYEGKESNVLQFHSMSREQLFGNLHDTFGNLLWAHFQ